MKNPYLRLFLITFNVLIWSTIIIGGLRYLGNQQSYTQFDHPLLDEKNLFIFQTNDDKSLGQITKIPSYLNNYIAMINLEYRGDYWHVVEVLSRNPYHSKSLQSLDDFLSRYKRSRLAINVVNKQLHRFDILKDKIASRPELLILFTTETTNVLREARRKQPKWIYMANHSLIARFQLMGALFLETVTQVDEDLIYINSEDELNPRLQKELTKRNKKLVLNIDQQKITDSQKNYSYFISKDLNKLIQLGEGLKLKEP